MFRVSFKSALIILLFTSFYACHQEQMVFNPTQLPQNFKYQFPINFEEKNINVGNNVTINGLLFPSIQKKGLVFYLHGNAGMLDSWGQIADLYVKNGYDFFIMDYRQFGKSTGIIDKEKEMYQDIQVVYDSIKVNYKESNIIIIGYSIGTAFATKLAADNYPKMLVLKAPYYSIPNLVNQYYFGIVPHFLIKFKLPTYKYLKQVKVPIIIFHGNNDKIIPIKSSYKLKKIFNKNDTLIVMDKQGHQGISNNPVYRNEIEKILKQ